jgi:hypothetical protein
MRSAVVFAAGVLAISLVQPAAAQTVKVDPDLFGQKRPAPKPPKVDWNWRPQADAAQPAKPSVVCGMTVIPADPKMDPKMRVTPLDTRTKYVLKVAEPTVCKTP